MRAAAVGVLAGRWLVGSGSLHRLKQQYGLQIMELSRDSHAVRTISKQKFPGLLVGGDTAEVLWRRTVSCHTTTYTAHSPYSPNASFCLLHLQVFSDPQLNDHPIKGKKKIIIIIKNNNNLRRPTTTTSIYPWSPTLLDEDLHYTTEVLYCLIQN